jgi:hypothetical protein
VYTPPNVTVTDARFQTLDGHLANSIQDFAGYHDQFAATISAGGSSRGATITYAVVVDQAGNTTPLGSPGFLSPLQQQTLVTSHELSESVTDPDVSTGWRDRNPSSGTFGGEVGDLTQETLPSGPIFGYLDGFLVQKEWSDRFGASVLSWAEVAGGGHTDAALAPAALGNQFFLFAKGINDDGIHVNRLGADGNLGGWQLTQGTGTTGSAPDATAFNGKLFLFSRDTDNRIYVNSSADGTTWSLRQEVGGTTDVALASAAFNGRLYLFGKGINDDGIYVNSSADGTHWAGWHAVGGTTDVALNASVFDGQLYLFGKGINDYHVYVNKLSAGGGWSGWAAVPGGAQTDAALGSAVVGNRLYLFGKGINDRGAYFNTTADGTNWSGWAEMPARGTTDAAIEAGAFNGQLFVFAKGINDRAIYQFVAAGFAATPLQPSGSSVGSPVAEAATNPAEQPTRPHAPARAARLGGQFLPPRPVANVLVPSATTTPAQDTSSIATPDGKQPPGGAAASEPACSAPDAVPVSGAKPLQRPTTRAEAKVQAHDLVWLSDLEWDPLSAGELA